MSTFLSMRTMLVSILLGIVLLTLLLFGWGHLRWQRFTDDIQDGLARARVPIQPAHVDPAEFAGLPAPVRRYFRAVLQEGQPMIAAVRMRHSGTFNMDEKGAEWKAFTSTQRVITRRPGFDWEARVSMMPLVDVRVHDAYVAGEGILRASLFGLIDVVDLRDRDETARGELLRFLAEAPWYPTALLPSQGTAWEAIDDTSARATLRDGDVSVSMLFRFNAEGLVASVRAEDRGRMMNGQTVATPWEGRWWGYELRGGMRIPTAGEVAWLPEEGPHPYWRGRVEDILYDFAD